MARRVFFSFHYPDVQSFRVNVIRNANVVKNRDIDETGFYDASIWETAKTRGPSALQVLIDAALVNTSVSAVLTGEHTYSRDWVRYEIAKSFSRGNGLLAIDIHNIKGKDGTYGTKGPNPFDFLASQVDAQAGRVKVLEWDAIAKKWVSFGRLPSFPLANLKGRNLASGQLSAFAKRYDWVNDNGYASLESWVEMAAIQAGR